MKRNKFGSFTLPDVKTCYEAISNTVIWPNRRHVDQWGGIEIPDIHTDPYN
jgi:hypothetical protein